MREQNADGKRENNHSDEVYFVLFQKMQKRKAAMRLYRGIAEKGKKRLKTHQRVTKSRRCPKKLFFYRKILFKVFEYTFR